MIYFKLCWTSRKESTITSFEKISRWFWFPPSAPPHPCHLWWWRQRKDQRLQCKGDLVSLILAPSTYVLWAKELSCHNLSFIRNMWITPPLPGFAMIISSILKISVIKFPSGLVTQRDTHIYTCPLSNFCTPTSEPYHFYKQVNTTAV